MEELLKDILKRVRKFYFFIMVVLDLEINIVIDFCKKYKVCYFFYVILFMLDKSVFYEKFYDIFDRNLKIFLLDLEIWV